MFYYVSKVENKRKNLDIQCTKDHVHIAMYQLWQTVIWRLKSFDKKLTKTWITFVQTVQVKIKLFGDLYEYYLYSCNQL